MKDHNGRSRADQKHWKCFGDMDGIYGERPASNGGENGLDTGSNTRICNVRVMTAY